MFLKSLTLRGFKSFADKTTLEFEPGVTVVVGPNGSGKSNLVDAVAWVLGAQAPRTLRGAKMDDVIFAGTPDRPALGRAEVSLTIDNTAQLLPIEFSEVTITRTLFRAGDSEYQINGAPCRLLDIQELLSDSGIGRQQHVIVGQGQLDAVLNARPEDRRAMVEEAAGILKFRKRRERAERRLEATEGSLLRLNDLLREVRRQLTPLQRQADAARRHGGLVDELRAIRLHLAGHEIAGLQAKAERLRDRADDLDRDQQGVQVKLRDLDLAVLDAEAALTTIGHGDVADALGRVEALRERAGGFAALLQEKRRGLDREVAAVADEGVFETLVADAAHVRAQLHDVQEQSDRVRRDRADGLAPERASLALEVEQRVTGEPEVAAAADAARDARLRAEAELASAEAAWRDAQTEAQRWQARADALEQTLDSARAAAGFTQLDGFPGVIGLLLDHLRIDRGCDAAVGAILGDALHAVVVDGPSSARAAVARLAAGDAGALVVIAGRDDLGRSTTERVAPPAGTRHLGDVVRSEVPGLESAVQRMVAGVVLATGGWSAALDVALEHPDLVVVTGAGDRFGGAGPWRLAGRTPGPSAALLDEARGRARVASEGVAAREQSVREARAAVSACRATEAEAGETARAARATLDDARRAFDLRAAQLDERRAVLERRLVEVEERLARDPERRARAERDRSVLERRAQGYRIVGDQLAALLERVDALSARWRAARRAEVERAADAGHQLDDLRRQRVDAERELVAIREHAQRRDVEEAETRLRLETAVERLRADFDVEPAAALDAPAPEAPSGTTLTGRGRELERELRLMGPINPLALEEHDALLERHEFLQAQLDDVKASRRELNRVIRAVDQEIVSVFAGAFDDVSRNFIELFSTLFPGGAGRLLLTDPDDILNTGIDMEARPSGKNVRRLSLLSGGERSLTALAFLCAVFRARPSPFYLMDEVEAALDDVNLHRFLDLVHEFRHEAQLLIVSHQKRTMEAGDSLYGVSMPPGGSSRVVSQRVDHDLPVG